MHIIVIGGGVIGTLSAYYLSKKGFQVTILERNNDISMEASAANASQLAFTSIYPIGTPSFFPTFPQTIIGLNASIKIKKWADIDFIKWGFSFLFQCTRRKSLYNEAALFALSQKSKICLESFLEENPTEFSYSQEGKLRLYDDKTSFEKAVASYTKKSRNFKKLSVEECFQESPILSKRMGPLAGGVLTIGDFIGDTIEFCHGVLDVIKRDYPQTEFRYNVDVKSIKINKKTGYVESISTNQGEMQADSYLVCAGAYTPYLLKRAALKTEIYPIKGYSIIIPDTDILYSGQIRHSLTDFSRNMVITPLRDRIKITAGMIFDGYNQDIDQKFVEKMKLDAKEIMPQIDFSKAKTFCGLRPATPSSLPLVQQIKNSNLYINSGHGMWGWTLAPVTCHQIAERIEKTGKGIGIG